MSKFARKAIRKVMRKIVRKAKRVAKKRRIIRKGHKVKAINHVYKPVLGSIQLTQVLV